MRCRKKPLVRTLTICDQNVNEKNGDGGNGLIANLNTNTDKYHTGFKF